jgi:hypothetical protein
MLSFVLVGKLGFWSLVSRAIFARFDSLPLWKGKPRSALR